MNCKICFEKIDDILVKYYNDNSEYFMETFGGLFCKKHLCECVPNITPWSYLIACNMCGKNYICKTCKLQTEGNNICYYCYDKIYR